MMMKCINNKIVAMSEFFPDLHTTTEETAATSQGSMVDEEADSSETLVRSTTSVGSSSGLET